MKTLEDYFRENLTRQDPFPAIDHVIRARISSDNTVTFYIHAMSRDSDTMDFEIRGNVLFPGPFVHREDDDA
jgi:hypothetical protein